MFRTKNAISIDFLIMCRYDVSLMGSVIRRTYNSNECVVWIERIWAGRFDTHGCEIFGQVHMPLDQTHDMNDILEMTCKTNSVAES